jgi:hypothetical protein
MDKYSIACRIKGISIQTRVGLALVATVIVVIGGNATALSADAVTTPQNPQHRAMDNDHLRAVIQFVTERIDEPQKGRVEHIASDAYPKLDVFDRRAAEVRAPLGQILLAEKIDRDALERARVTEMRITDERSRYVNSLLIDVVEGLTPQQRAVLRKEMVQ